MKTEEAVEKLIIKGIKSGYLNARIDPIDKTLVFPLFLINWLNYK